MVSELAVLLRLDSAQVAWEVVLSHLVPDNKVYDERLSYDSLGTAFEADLKHHIPGAISPHIPLRLSQGALATKINSVEGAT